MRICFLNYGKTLLKFQLILTYMGPEKEITLRWLNSNGYFTYTNINTGGRTIDILAIKSDDSKVKTIYHIEVYCPISAKPGPKEKRDIILRFNDTLVTRKVESILKKQVGESKYENILVCSEGIENLENIKVIKFEDVLFEVIKDLDTQNYRNDTLRTLQLVKHILLSNPTYAHMLLGLKSGRKKEAIVKEMMSSEHGRNAFKKKSSESALLDLLRSSPLINSEKVLSALADDILTSRSKSYLLRKIMPKQEAIQRKEMTLESFYA